MMMLVRQSSTVVFVICTSVKTVHNPYPAPRANSTAASGAKIFIGLKSVTMRKMMSANFAPFANNFCPLLPPCRLFAAIGTNFTV